MGFNHSNIVFTSFGCYVAVLIFRQVPVMQRPFYSPPEQAVFFLYEKSTVPQ
jgi:hypothetical protein